MLVLSRKIGEGFMIGDNIWVTVTDLRGRVVQVGIEAPREVPIVRDELYEPPPGAPERAAKPPVRKRPRQDAP